MTQDKSQIEQIRDCLEVLRLADECALLGPEQEKVRYIARVNLDAVLGL